MQNISINYGQVLSCPVTCHFNSPSFLSLPYFLNNGQCEPEKQTESSNQANYNLLGSKWHSIISEKASLILTYISTRSFSILPITIPCTSTIFSYSTLSASSPPPPPTNHSILLSLLNIHTSNSVCTSLKPPISVVFTVMVWKHSFYVLFCRRTEYYCLHFRTPALFFLC